MKALAHEPERRYPSAAALAEDLRRYLTSRPVDARPDSRGYRLRKFVMRHRLGVAASGRRRRGRARCACRLALRDRRRPPGGQARRGRPGLSHAASSSRSILTVTPVRPPPCAIFWSAAASALDRELAEQPELRAEMHALLGQVFDQLVAAQTRARRTGAGPSRRGKRSSGPGDARTVKAKKGLAISLARQARYAEAEPLFKELLEQEQALGDKREMAACS